MEKEVVIREVKKNDYPAIADLSCQLEHDMTKEEAKERINNVIKDPTQTIFIAESRKEILGYVNVVARYELLSGVQSRIEGLVVDQKARGLGLGKLLMKKAEDWGKEMGSKTMKLVSNSKRIDAHKFYEHIGYLKTKEQAAFKKFLGD